MTGRAAGFCAGYPVPGYMNPVGGRGFWGRGGGRGGGRGFRHWYYATGVPGWARGGFGYPAADWAAPLAPRIAPEQELEGLKRQAKHLQDTIGQINERIDQLQAAANCKNSV